MSDFFRVPLVDLSTATIRELARQAHIAENTDDDVLLMNAQAELESRETVYNGLSGTYRGHDRHDLFMEHYRDLWATEFNPNKKGKKR